MCVQQDSDRNTRRVAALGRWRVLAPSLAAICACLASGAALAQGAPAVSRPVVQSLPGAGSAALNAALSRLGRNPRDSSALLDAGNAASAMGDFDAAIGFYRRAEQIVPADTAVKLGLAQALSLSGDPVAALAAFDAAEKAGASPAQMAADRGLAYDLVGDNLTAQRYYAMAPRGGAGEDGLRMRLALSQAIGGDQAASELTLMPLMRQSDKPAWRTRAFALAIGGDVAQATSVVQTILPGELAERIVPYLRYMPRLTRAQQAAAANLGKFPRAAEVGIDDTKIAAITPAGGFPRHMAAVAEGLVPKGEPLGTRRSRKGRADARTVTSAGAATGASTAAGELAARAAPARTAPPDVSATVTTTTPPPVALAANGELPPVSRQTELPPLAPVTGLRPAPAATPAPTTTPAPAQAQVQAQAPAQVAVATASARTTVAPLPRKTGPGFDLSRLPQSRVSNTAAEPAGTPPTVAASLPVKPAVTPPAATLPPATKPAVALVATAQPATSVPATTLAPAPSTPPPLAAAAPTASAQPTAAATVSATAPTSSSAPASAAGPAPEPASLARIFADLDKPTLNAAPVPGAVDISRITPSRPEAKPPVEPRLADAKPADTKTADTKAADARTGDAKLAAGKVADPKACAKAVGRARIKACAKVDEVSAEDAKAAQGKVADPKACAKAVGKARIKACAKVDASAEAKKPAVPAHPSRIWVQLGVGRSKPAIAFDWRRMARQSATLFKGKGPFVADYGQTNRVLAGPFETEKAAEAFLKQAQKGDIDKGAHVWTSQAGQVVDPLAAD